MDFRYVKVAYRTRCVGASIKGERGQKYQPNKNWMPNNKIDPRFTTIPVDWIENWAKNRKPPKPRQLSPLSSWRKEKVDEFVNRLRDDFVKNSCALAIPAASRSVSRSKVSIEKLTYKNLNTSSNIVK